jgi:Tfp pilus assembly protein PilF
VRSTLRAIIVLASLALAGQALAQAPAPPQEGANKAAADYFKLCASLYNMGKTGADAIAACDQAIAADPKKAAAYFVKGSILYGNGTIDKNNKYMVPPGTVETLKQYLAVAPSGPHVPDVKAMLDALN